MLKVKETWRGCVSLLLEVRALLQGLGSLQRSHRQTEQDRLITWSPGVAPKYLSSASALFNSQPGMLGFSAQHAVHLLMHPAHSYYSKTLFPLFVYGKVHRISPMGLEEVKRQPTPNPLFSTNPVILPQELEWYVTISAWKTHTSWFFHCVVF